MENTNIMGIFPSFFLLLRLRWQRENGLMNRAKRRWFPKKPNCEGKCHLASYRKIGNERNSFVCVLFPGGGPRFLEVGLQEVKPALELLAIGFSLPIFILIIEILMKRAIEWTKRNEKAVQRNWRSYGI